MLTRREWLQLGAAGVLADCGRRILESDLIAADKFEVTHTDAEWRTLLTPSQYAVLRKEATERPFSSPLDREKRRGTFACAGCALELFSSATKFDSGTGWPSFWAPLENAAGTT